MKESLKIQAFIVYLKAVRKIKSQTEFGEILGYHHKSSISRVIKEPNVEFLERLEKTFPEYKDFNPIGSNVKHKNYSSYIEVRLVTTKARAGYADAFYSQEFLKDMPTILIESDNENRGNFLAFEVENDSMETEYYEGDVLITEEVNRELWSYKLPIKEYDFVIAHGKNGVIFKEITEHNEQTGDITCHSINSKYDDFIINLREVAYLYKVIEVRSKGRHKKFRRL